MTSRWNVAALLKVAALPVTGALLVPVVVRAAEAERFDPAAPWVWLAVLVAFAGGMLLRDRTAYLLAVEAAALGCVGLFAGLGLHIREFHETWRPWIGFLIVTVIFSTAILLLVAELGIRAGNALVAIAKRLGRFFAGRRARRRQPEARPA